MKNIELARSEAKLASYQLLEKQLAALLSNSDHMITNLSQFSAFIFMNLERINWAGFYLALDPNELLLGPFQGKVACTHIPLGKGVCGTSAVERATLVVADVDQFAGHIACDSASRSEIVIPLIVEGDLKGVLDIDSPELARFDDIDARGLEALIKVLITSTKF